MYIRSHNGLITHWDAMLHEDGWREGSDEMVEEIRLGLEQLRCLLLHDSLQGLSIGRRYTIPRLWLTPREIKARWSLSRYFQVYFHSAI